MPRTSNLERVHAILERDRPWAAYAIGDLSPAFAPQSEWRIDDRDEALVLAYRGFDRPIAFAMGADAAVSRLFAELDAPEISLHIKTSTLNALPPAFSATAVRPMWRMVLDRLEIPESNGTVIDALTMADLDEIAALYGEGNARGESPDFFFADMLNQGTFRGIRRSGALVAAAGTHIVDANLGICAIGNVYTRSDSRGSGLGRCVTAAVASHARELGVQTIVLNVRQSNAAARRLYEGIGFRPYCEFVEGLARRVEVRAS